MKKYELAIVAKPNFDDEAAKAVFEKIQGLITKFGGTIEKVDAWGKRRMAYEIKKFSEGIYCFITYTAEASVPAELESRLRIDEDLLRYLNIAVEL